MAFKFEPRSSERLNPNPNRLWLLRRQCAPLPSVFASLAELW